ncbi:MAG: ESPR-type extended signal peptide-containing protein [Rhodanobacter sp.]
MNTIYKLVWNAATGKCAVAPELAKGRKKKGGVAAAITVALALSMGSGGVLAAEDAGSTETRIAECASDDVDASNGCHGSSTTSSISKTTDATNASGPIGVMDLGNYGVANAGTDAANASASGPGSVAVGSGAAANGNVATAIGYASVATGVATLAVGDQAKATADHATALGFMANAGYQGAVALGWGATPGIAHAIAIGTSATTMGATDGSTAIGWNASADSTMVTAAWSATSIGTNTIASGDGATSLGDSSHSEGYGALALGRAADALEDSSIAMGAAAQVAAGAAGGMALGAGAQVGAGALAGVALGSGARVAAGTLSSMALGTNAFVTGDMSVALGSGSLADRDSSISVGTAGFQRQIVNVAAGTQPTDAVNVSQLAPVVAAFGGGASIDPNTGAVTGPTYNLANGGTATNVGDALSALDGAITSNTTNIATNTANIATNTSDITNLQGQIGNVAAAGVQYDDPSTKTQVTLGGAGAASEVTLTNVAPGALNATSTDAVNGAQLFSVQSTANQNKVDISNLWDSVNALDDGVVGLVRQDLDTREINVATSTDGLLVNFAGIAGARVLDGVADGLIASGSNQAINGGQLYDLSNALSSQIGDLSGRVGVIEAGAGTVEPPPGGGVGNDAGGAPITNVGAGVAPTDAANVGQVNALVQESLQASNAYTDNRVNALSDSLDNFKNDTNQRFQRLDNRLDRIGAMGAANTQMAINAAGVTNQRGRVAVGVGVQNSKAAMAVGYANTLGERTRMSVGGAFSGSETSVGVGFGVDL